MSYITESVSIILIKAPINITWFFFVLFVSIVPYSLFNRLNLRLSKKAAHLDTFLNKFCSRFSKAFCTFFLTFRKQLQSSGSIFSLQYIHKVMSFFTSLKETAFQRTLMLEVTSSNHDPFIFFSSLKKWGQNCDRYFNLSFIERLKVKEWCLDLSVLPC